MNILKEAWPSIKLIVFPAEIFSVILLKYIQKEVKIIGDNALFDDKKKHLTEEIALDIVCRAYLNKDVMASSREMKVKTLFIDFIVNFLLILFSVVSLSMVFWTILFGIPVYISILVVIIFSYKSIIILFANIGICRRLMTPATRLSVSVFTLTLNLT